MTIESGLFQSAKAAAAFCLLMLVPGAIFADTESPVDTSQLMSDAISHYDLGDFDTAAGLLRQVLEQEPNNGTAAYELALTYAALDDLKSCRATAKKYRRKLRNDADQADLLPQLYLLEATCYSKSGASRKALKVFREGLEQHPDDYGLNFNIAITLIQDEQYDGGILHLERAIAADPSHPSPYFVIATAYRGVGRTARSLMAYLTFLQHEFNTERSAIAAQSVIDLLYSDVERTDEGVTIYTHLGSSPDDLDTEGLIRLVVAEVAAAGFTEDGIKEPLCDTGSHLITAFISASVWFVEKEGAGDFLVDYLLPGIEGLHTEELSKPFSYFVMSAAGVEGADEWLESNTQAVDDLVQYFQMTAGAD